MMQAVQDLYAPHNKCFGCGPQNDHGLQIKSFIDGDRLVAFFTPKSYHQAFDNVLNGGICGTLLDCHSNWCAAMAIMNHRHEDAPPCTVTARFAVDLLMPTPMDKELKVVAETTLVTNRKAEVKAQIIAGDQITARCEGIFIAVEPGHPAYHRW